MTNRQFLTELRRELNNAKRQFLIDNPYQKVCKYDNLDKAYLKALKDFSTKFKLLTAKDITKMIVLNPSVLRFLNYCLELEPNLVKELRAKSHLDVYETIYVNMRRCNYNIDDVLDR